MISSSLISPGQSNDNQNIKNRCSSRQSLIGSGEINKVNIGANANPNAYLGNGKDTDPKKNAPPQVTGKGTFLTNSKLNPHLLLLT